MMTLLRYVIREAVIDASKRFTQRRADNFTTKLQTFANDMQGVFERQKELEREVNERLTAVTQTPESFVSHKRMRLAVPAAFTDNEWGPSGSIFSIIGLVSSYDDYYDDVVRFVWTNADSFRRSVVAVEKALKDVEQFADEFDWPAPWKRYTQWGVVQNDTQRYVSSLRRMLGGR